MEHKQAFEVRDLRQKEKFVVDDRFLNGYAKFVGIYAIGVYVALCRHANKEQSAWPSIGKIAEELNISVPMVDSAIWILELFNIIRKRRLGKMLNNRYWLVDKKEWVSLTSEAVDKLLSDLNSIKNTDLNNVKITIKRRLNHDLTMFKSNSKETHSKETHSKEQKEYQALSATSTKSPVDNLPYPEPSKEELKKLAEVTARVSQDGFSKIYIFIQRVRKEAGHFPPPKVMIKACQRYLEDKEKINNPWAWFVSVVRKESGPYFAQLHIEQNEQYKNEPAQMGSLLRQMATQT